MMAEMFTSVLYQGALQQAGWLASRISRFEVPVKNVDHINC